MAQADFSILPFGAGGIPANENSGTSLAAPRWYYGTAAPTAGTYNLGDILFNVNQTLGSSTGWICYAAGTPGSWQTFGALGSDPIPTIITAATGTLAIAQRTILLNPATTGTYSLPEATSYAAGSRLTVKNISANLVTLSPLGTDAYADATAITLVQNQGIDLFSNAGTVWYNETTARTPALKTTATSGTLANGQRLILLNPASTGTYSLPEASANFAGFQMTIKNLASGSTTLTPLASDGYESASVAAITLAQYAVINLITDSTTNWYKSS